SRDDKLKVTTAKPVTKLFRNNNKQIYSVSLQNSQGELEKLGTTAEHPFYVNGKGWVEASGLAPGDLVESHETGEEATSFLEVKSVVLESQRQDTYNFEVADTHTYFVGKLKAWVHNTCDPVELLANGGKYLDKDTIIGAYGSKFTQQTDGSFSKIGSASSSEISTVGLQVRTRVEVDKAVKGSTEYELLNNPPADSWIELDNGTNFKTNGFGYVEEITYKPLDAPGVRDGRQTKVGKEGIAGDVGGHIQACRHGGTCDRFNLFPQNSNFNNSAYKTWENEITRALQNGEDVGNVTVRFTRANPGGARPESLEIEYQINGRTFTKDFDNQAGG
ncbi:polymorphic toxin-type HINT domain-containing protein, partial [Pseudovibrio sp. POLY-S9]|uniref:polymorphic toxin-type HINT domain-containing protein n=1 Tax=Pseudovibrio sp. POLY-S9 TaxID=1576596 RepID=UPI000AF66D1E